MSDTKTALPQQPELKQNDKTIITKIYSKPINGWGHLNNELVQLSICFNNSASVEKRKVNTFYNKNTIKTIVFMMYPHDHFYRLLLNHSLHVFIWCCCLQYCLNFVGKCKHKCYIALGLICPQHLLTYDIWWLHWSIWPKLSCMICKTDAWLQNCFLAAMHKYDRWHACIYLFKTKMPNN